MKKKLYIVFVLLLISTMLISGFFLYNELKEDNEQEKIFENLIEIAEETEKQEKEQEEDNINIANLYQINSDIIGWVKIKGTNIDYPVMQTKNNPNYYLRRNFYKEYSVMGTPYLAEQCDIQSSDNLIIYGHHISNNKMFGELENYKQEDYYKEHKIIKFYTMEENAEYEIIAVFKTVAYTGFKYYNYCNLKSESEFIAFINKCYDLAFYDTGKKAEYGDKLICLSTCEYSQTNGRLVVVARKIK